MRRFYDGYYLRYPVVDSSGLVGVISRSDLMRVIGEYWAVAWESHGIRGS